MDKDKTILIIDDDEDSRFFLRYFLKDKFEIIEAYNGKDGIEKAVKDNPNLILIDIMMPIMDGYTATRLIRENDFFKSIPIIALSANSNENERERCLMVGCNDFIEKPVDLNVLIEIIKKYI